MQFPFRRTYSWYILDLVGSRRAAFPHHTPNYGIFLIVLLVTMTMASQRSLENGCLPLQLEVRGASREILSIRDAPRGVMRIIRARTRFKSLCVNSTGHIVTWTEDPVWGKVPTAEPCVVRNSEQPSYKKRKKERKA